MALIWPEDNKANDMDNEIDNRSATADGSIHLIALADRHQFKWKNSSLVFHATFAAGLSLEDHFLSCFNFTPT